MFLFLLATVVSGQAEPSRADPSTPNALQALAACRGLADPAARLACFDKASDDLQQAVASKAVVVMDKAEVAQTKRSFFGLSLPKIRLFGGGEGDGPKEITSSLKQVIPLGYGKWRGVLEDGAAWETTEPGGSLAREPKTGTAVRIWRGAAGGYFMKASGHGAVRARRVG